MLKEKFPADKVRVKQKTKQVVNKKIMKKQAPPKKNNHIKKLETELTEIEERLNKIGV